MPGFVGRLARVNLSKGKAREDDVEGEVREEGGGSGGCFQQRRHLQVPHRAAEPSGKPLRDLDHQDALSGNWLGHNPKRTHENRREGRKPHKGVQREAGHQQKG